MWPFGTIRRLKKERDAAIAKGSRYEKTLASAEYHRLYQERRYAELLAAHSQKVEDLSEKLKEAEQLLWRMANQVRSLQKRLPSRGADGKFGKPRNE